MFVTPSAAGVRRISHCGGSDDAACGPDSVMALKMATIARHTGSGVEHSS